MPGETSPAPPWSKPLFSSNQPWAQKRNAATTANPTQSGQWVRLMQIIRLPQLDGAGPPGANPWRESRQFCISPVLPPHSRWQRRLGPGAAGTSSTSPLATAWFLPSERSGGPLAKPGRAENGSLPSFPRNLSSPGTCLQEGGERERREQPVACRESFPWRAAAWAGLRSRTVGMVFTMAAQARAGPFPTGGCATLAASAPPASAPPALPSAATPLPVVSAELVPALPS